MPLDLTQKLRRKQRRMNGGSPGWDLSGILAGSLPILLVVGVLIWVFTRK
jgi:hypothetical protein